MFNVSNKSIPLRLSEAKKNKKYVISSIHDNGAYLDKFNKLGFYPGQVVELRRKAPLFGNPLLFQIDDGQYALTKNEAMLVEVTDLDSE
ncbi:MAG: FeoA family protein [Bacteriovoracaceae bacterium]